MNQTNRHRGGISLIEVMIVVTIIAVIAGLVIPHSGTEVAQQLESTAELIGADIAYCQSLAVSNNSKYRLLFSVLSNRYSLVHSGDDASLDVLPEGVFQTNINSTTRRTNLTSLSSMGSIVHLHAVVALTPTPVDVSTLEFGPLGETKRSQETVIWLECGGSSDRRYLPITVDPVTGLTEIGVVQTSAP